MNLNFNGPDTIVFKQIIEGIKDLVKETIIYCNSDSISIQALDSAHVALVSLMLVLPQNYNCKQNVAFGISLNVIGLLLKCLKTDDCLSIDYKNGDDICKFRIEGPKTCTDFNVKLMNIDSEKLEIPNVAYGTILEMDSSEFKTTVNNLALVSDHCEISTSDANPDILVFVANGTVGTMTVNQKCKIISSSTVIKAAFSIGYLQSFITNLNKTIRIYLDPENPLIVEYRCLNKDSYIKYYLAPKLMDS